MLKLFKKSEKPKKIKLQLLERDELTMDRETAELILELASDPRFKMFIEQLDASKSEAFHKLMDIPLETQNYPLQVAAAQGYLKGLEEAKRLIRLCRKALGR